MRSSHDSSMLTVRVALRRWSRMVTALLLVFFGVLGHARSEISSGVLQPNDLFMPVGGGIVAFKNTFDPVDPVRGWFIERSIHGLEGIGGITLGPDGCFYLASH